jgi:hypothetical protein
VLLPIRHKYGKDGFPVGKEKALTLPHSALVERGQLEGVYIVNSQQESMMMAGGETI